MHFITLCVNFISLKTLFLYPRMLYNNVLYSDIIHLKNKLYFEVKASLVATPTMPFPLVAMYVLHTSLNIYSS